MYLVSKVEILLSENDDLAHKMSDNTKIIRRDLAAVKKQISLSKNKAAVSEGQIRRLNRLDAESGLRDDGRPLIDERDVQANRDCHLDEQRKPMGDIEESSGCEIIETGTSDDDIREIGTSSSNIRAAGSTDDDLIETGFNNIIDDIRAIATIDDDDDVREIETRDNDARGVSCFIPLDEFESDPVESEQLDNNNVSDYEVDYSHVSEDDLRQMLKLANEAIKSSDKNLEGQRKELKGLERHSGQGRSQEWMMQMRKTISKVQKNMSVIKSAKKKMELKVWSVRKELEKRKVVSKKVVQSGSLSNVLPSSSKRLKRNLDESVIDCGMIRKVSVREKNAMVIKELLKEEDPSDDTFECNFCTKVFTSAGPLTAHLANHSSGNKCQKLDCPWPECSF